MTVPTPSALQTLLTPPSNHPSDPLALQIAHNLRHQHHWTRLRLHTPSSPSTRTLLSGLPPKTLYLHPDEQLALLQKQHDAGLDATSALTLPPEREWVLPARLDEKWTLKGMAGVFDSIERIPGREEGEAVFEDNRDDADVEEQESDADKEGERGSQWRKTQPKRLLMAIADEDSTVAYYIVHDGVVKPRQN